MNSPFETRLRSAVRRFDRRNNHESQIKEVVAHYQDLTKEMGEERAAEKRMGNPVDIARDIVTTPHQIRLGNRLQWVGTLIVLSGPLVYRILPFNILDKLRKFAPLLWKVAIDPFCLAGICCFVAGFFLARKLNRGAFATGTMTLIAFLSLIFFLSYNRPIHPVSIEVFAEATSNLVLRIFLSSVIYLSLIRAYFYRRDFFRRIRA